MAIHGTATSRVRLPTAPTTHAGSSPTALFRRPSAAGCRLSSWTVPVLAVSVLPLKMASFPRNACKPQCLSYAPTCYLPSAQRKSKWAKRGKTPRRPLVRVCSCLLSSSLSTMAQSSEPAALDDPPSTPPRLRPKNLRAIAAVPEEGDQSYESEGDEPDASDDPNYEPTPVAQKTRKRRTKSFNKPFKRRNTSSSLLTAQRRNVDATIKALEPNATSVYCVVTRASASMTILEYAHVVPVSTRGDVLDKLEWVWNQGHGTFNVDTQRNVHPLDIVLHRYFDCTDGNTHNGWFWCPDNMTLILIMFRRYMGRELTSPPVPIPNVRCNPDELYGNIVDFKYRFIPFPSMRENWSIRKPTTFVSEFTPQTDVQQFHYPFTDLPVIILHVPYHFVIYDTGRKLFNFYKAMQPVPEQIMQDFSVEGSIALSLFAVWHIYGAWMNATPSQEWKSASGPTDIGTPGGQAGAGGHSSHDGGQSSGSHGPPNDTSGSPQGGPGPGAGGIGDDGHAPPSFLPPLGPNDSASCCDLSVDKEESGEEAQVDGTEDEEWEDPEYGEYLNAWVEDVWKATQDARQPPSCAQKAPSLARSQDTLVSGPPNGKDVLPRGLNASGPVVMST
ncbi:hypothetical protein C8Q78DRAFT_352902 [Trametes maxima]|nr:hypothetical protein C8Q78DRAFT_352902 [Trametes maxima]